METPVDIQLIGNEVAVIWDDKLETYYPVPALRAASPSAETQGERDILGNLHGGEQGKDYSQVRVLEWKIVGNYAICFQFNDGHKSGLYTFAYLRELSERLPFSNNR